MNNTYTRNGRQRVVVTGIGAVTPLGNDAASSWQALLAGKSGVTPITAFDASGLPTRIAANVKGFDAGKLMDPKEARRLSPFIHYAVAAAAEAVAGAGLDFATEDTSRAGAEIGSALGGTSVLEEQRLILENKGPRAINPTVVTAIIINSAACQIAIRYGIHGPVGSPVAACATGTVAIGEAFCRLAWGMADLMIAGGTESVMTPLAITAFARLGATSQKNDTPEQACAPFDKGRDGTVVGEGAAVMVLETLEHAVKRNAPILAEVMGYGLTCDAFHLVAPGPTGEMAARAMRQALDDGGVAPEELSWIVAHGTGTQLNDSCETKAIKLALGEAAARHVPATSVKGALGHMLGAAGAISAVTAVQAINAGVLAPTINYQTPDPECDLDYVPNVARAAAVNAVLTNAFGFGGQNACLVFRKWEA
ncbi:MAG: beta-ketoacyl-ACP synthase II [Chloroflexi bacterium]|nr:beta-ketoacyl-ACP synthase II [Chloroflexota bacterium]